MTQLVTVGATLFIGIVVLSQIGDAMPETGMFNNSFDSVLESVWNDSLKEVSERLLGEG